MALLTAEERASLGRFNVINQHLDIAQRLTDAETIQCVGDTATAHARLLALPQPGDTLRVEGSGALDRTGSFVPGCDVTYEFTTGPPVSAGHVPVLIGATPAETATTLAAIITRTTTLPVVAAAHSIDTTTVDVCHTIPGAPLTLSSSAGGRCVTQSNNEQLPIDCYVLILRRRTITAEDVARGSIRFDTCWSSIVEGFASLYRSAVDQTPEPFGGVVSYLGGVLELTQSTGGAATQFAAGNVMHLQLLGVR